MTSPAIDSNADELLTLEDRSAVRVSAPARRELQAVGKLLLMEWAKVSKPPTAQELAHIREVLGARLAGVKLGSVVQTLDSIMSTALNLGVDHALQEVDRDRGDIKKPRPDRASRQAVGSAAASASA